MRTLRGVLGGALLFAQVAAMAHARFVPSRYFCWAPYDSLSVYAMDVQVNGRALTAEEILRRYRVPQGGRENRSIQHLIDLISQYETTYGRADRARVALRYRTNGHEEHTWRWPAR
jgi:hypothetical protein